MKIAVVGSRNYPNSKQVREFIQSLPADTTIVSGACGEGPDSWAEQEAKHCGLRLILYPVDKRTLPKYPEDKQEFAIRAYARNQKIAAECDEMVAFWYQQSGGTWNAISHAKNLGKPVRVIEPDTPMRGA